MTEHEKWDKVIKGLETCEMSGTREDCEGYGCPYFIYNDEVSDDCQVTLFNEALALLKAQEPVKPKWEKGYAYCGKCGYKLHWIVDQNNFCPNCGQAVKWE